jgi:hypothetical protein
VRLTPGDEDDANGLVGRAQRVHKQRVLAKALEQLAGRVRRVRALRERDRLACVQHA